jgi:hypothetical protein
MQDKTRTSSSRLVVSISLTVQRCEAMGSTLVGTTMCGSSSSTHTDGLLNLLGNGLLVLGSDGLLLSNTVDFLIGRRGRRRVGTSSTVSTSQASAGGACSSSSQTTVCTVSRGVSGRVANASSTNASTEGSGNTSANGGSSIVTVDEVSRSVLEGFLKRVMG